MKIKTISYSQSRESVNAAGLKEWVKIGAECEIEQGESSENAFLSLKEHVQRWHKESNPSSYFQQEEIPVIQSKDR